MFENLRIATTGPAAVAEDTDLNVWLANGLPVRAVWLNRRWRVVDEPTRLGNAGADWGALLSSPATEWVGWRFCARAEDNGESRVFDVVELGQGRWRLLHAWS